MPVRAEVYFNVLQEGRSWVGTGPTRTIIGTWKKKLPLFFAAALLIILFYFPVSPLRNERLRYP